LFALAIITVMLWIVRAAMIVTDRTWIAALQQARRCGPLSGTSIRQLVAGVISKC
jgi:hypothetical protein